MQKKQCKTSYILGLNAEFIAANYLINLEYQIIAKRYKTKYGEIDLIAIKNTSLLFVEVKYRNKVREFEEILNVNRLNRHRNAIDYFLSNNECYSQMDCQLDLIVISKRVIILHLHNILI